MALLTAQRRMSAPRSPARRRRGTARAYLVATLSLCAAAPAGAQSLELAIKATYLYKLAPFVSWPAATYAAPSAPLVICIQGADPFGPVLDRATSGQAVGAHPVVVRRIPRVEADSGCHIAYLAGGPAQSQAQALEVLEAAPVLTVTDEARGKGARGIVHLVLESGRVRFSIDAGRAEASGVAISSKLLALAVAVKR
jgi:hypothetical protein